MKEVFFKRVLIADPIAKTARFVEFERGLNVMTSADNHVGKSSLLKSLYYGLGAEVAYDEVWDRGTKLYCVTIGVDDTEFQVCRMGKRFAVFEDGTLALLTDHVTRELAPFLEKAFDFAVYLPNKKNGRVELAPPAFSYMPYYIDQDTGWSGLYESFASIEQYKKDDRSKSLYYHLNIYTKKTVELMAQRDSLKDQSAELQVESTRLRTILTALQEEVDNLPSADDLSGLEAQLEIPKKRIEGLVLQVGQARNRMQELEVSLQQQQHKLHIIQEYRKIKAPKSATQKDELTTCPNCGYIFDKELFEMVRAQYVQENEEYICQQIRLIIDTVSERLGKAKDEYISLTTQLKAEETTFHDKQDRLNLYLRQRGLSDTINRFTHQWTGVQASRAEIAEEIKKIDREIRKLPQKDDVEEKYVEFVRANIIKLDAWNSKYDGHIRLLKPIKAQGTLENKIILAQFVGLFQTMDYFKSNATRFSFVIDSPRGKEASVSSSKGIVKLIAQLSGILPQVILATVDYEMYQPDAEVQANVITLTDQQHLLNEADYAENEEYIKSVLDLLGPDNFGRI